MSKKYDLSPGIVGTIFSISTEQWNAINLHVFYISKDSNPNANTYARRFANLKSYKEVKRTSDLWASTTFIQIEWLADNVSNIISKDVISSLDNIKTLAARMDSDHGVWINEGAAFSWQCNNLSTILKQLEKYVNAVYPQILDFADKTTGGALEYQKQTYQDYNIDNLEPDISELLSGLIVLKRRWHELSSDIENLAQFVKENLSKDSPFLVGLEIDLGYKEWQTVVNDATTFIKNAGNQKRIISGEAFYDKPQIQPDKSYSIVANHWYTGQLSIRFPWVCLTLLNKAFLEVENEPPHIVEKALRKFCNSEKERTFFDFEPMFKDLLKYVLNEGCLIMAQLRGNCDQQSWIFERWDWGRYRIYNMSLGEDFALQGTWEKKLASMTPTQSIRGQCWHLQPFTPCGYGETRVALVNSELGSICALGIYPFFFQPFMAPRAENQKEYLGFYLWKESGFI